MAVFENARSTGEAHQTYQEHLRDYDKSEAAVRQGRQLTEWFRTTVGVKQGCTLSPDLFNLVLEAVMRLALENEEVGLELCGRLVNNL